ncbi:MAG: MATE family efflux transporter [Lachnospiraceae bacterium]
MTKDLTEGKPSRVLLGFSLPLLFSVMFQQFYNIVDSVVAGKYIGVDALAAVGASYPITMIFMAVATGANIGSSVVISQFFGAKKYEKMKTSIFTSLILIIIVSILLTLCGSFGCDFLIRALNTPANVFSDAALYLSIYTWGLVFLFLYNICTGVFTALGDSKTPLYFLIVSSLGNVAMDLLFVIRFQMGVAGVAWATFLCQGLAAVLAVVALLRRLNRIETKESFPLFSWDMAVRISRIAIPSILQQSFISIGNLFIQRLVNGYGSSVMAAYSAAVKLNTFMIVSLSTLANGLSNFTAQNIGAGKISRVKEGYKAGIRMVFAICIPVVFLYFFYGSTVMRLFLSGKDNVNTVLQEGVLFLRIISPFYFVVSLKLVTDGVLRGAGDMVSFMITTFSDLILRVLLSYLFAKGLNLGSMGIWLSWPVGWFAGTILSLIFYCHGKWKKMYAV